MKRTYFTLYIILLYLIAISSCKKDTGVLTPGGASSLTIVNGVVGSNFFYANFNGLTLSPGTYYSNLEHLHFRYGGVYFSSSYSGEQKLGLFHDSDTLASSMPVLNLILNLPVNTIHTLFLTGTLQTPDTLITTDYLPYHIGSDSTANIRFVNISQGNAPVSINLVGKPYGSEVAILAYKGITVFRNYPVGSNLEFRDRNSGELLGSCVLPKGNRYANYTAVLLGKPIGYPLNRVLLVTAVDSRDNI